ncbi:MAG: hypothetical protein PHN72_03930 [Bacilli bacterium]|nr:hypothetical protein [Bacilli bacterium]
MLNRKKLLFMSKVFSILMILFAILLLFNYETVMKRGSVLIGIIFLAVALFFLIKYIMNRNMMQTFDLSILFMVFSLGFGILFLFIPTLTESLLKGLIGLCMIAFIILHVESIFTNGKDLGKKYITFLVVEVLCFLGSIMVLFNINQIMKGILLSVFLIAFGGLHFFIGINLSKEVSEE